MSPNFTSTKPPDSSYMLVRSTGEWRSNYIALQRPQQTSSQEILMRTPWGHHVESPSYSLVLTPDARLLSAEVVEAGVPAGIGDGASVLAHAPARERLVSRGPDGGISRRRSGASGAIQREISAATAPPRRCFMRCAGSQNEMAIMHSDAQRSIATKAARRCAVNVACRVASSD